MKIFLHTLRESVSWQRLLAIIVLFAACPGVYAQSRTVTGTVTNKQKEAIPGVSVYTKGTTLGTMSDAEGKYSIQVSDSATLVFTAIGFTKQEARVGNRLQIDITLGEDAIGLEEVIVVGYGEQKRSNITGSISSVGIKDMENKTQLRLDQALQGMAAGVTVARNGGAPGDKPTIHVRGAGSINPTDPLWVVDGVRMDPGNQFDLDDVDNIEILKDAAASAIYGSRAAHGVILVTTKRGKGGLQINFKSSITKRQPINLPHLLNSAEFVQYKKQSRQNANQNPEPSWDNYQYDTDWIGAYYNGSGMLQSYDLSVSKGDDKFNYYISFGHDNEDGILIDNTFKRYSLRINSDTKLFPWLKMGESLLLSQVDENPVSNFNENHTGGIPYRSIPIMPIYDNENPYGGWGMGPVYFQGPNPVATQYQQHEYRKSVRIDGNTYLEATPVKGLLIRGNIGYNYLNYSARKFDEAFDYGSFANPNAALTYNTSDDLFLLANAVATYTKALGKHEVKIMGGYEAAKFDSRRFVLVGNGAPVDVIWSFNLVTGAFSSPDRYTTTRRRQLSTFGRLNYSFDDRILLEANLRRDASAPMFGPSHLWGTFPSVSLGWRISQERFFENVPFITNLKLRASTGKLGSDNIDAYLYAKTYTSQFSTYSFDDKGSNKVPGFFISKFPNEDVKWEEVNMHDVAIDLKAFENKFSLSIDYYIKDTKDLLYAIPIPSSVGIAVHNFDPVNPAVNIGTMRNTGVDIEMGYATNIQKFALNVTGNVSFMRNKLLTLSGDASIVGGSGGGQIGGMTRTQPGHPISSFYGYQVQQMLNSDADVYAINTWAPDGLYQEAGTGPGDFMYRDISGPNGVPDGQVTAEYDRTFLGNPWPKMTYGFNINAGYNQVVDISIQLQGVQGVDIFNANKAYTRNFFGDNNATNLIFDAWTPERHTENPRNIANDPNGNWSRASSYFIEDGSYLKVRNVQIGVTIPRRFLDRAHITRLRIYANANNLLTFTKYSGFDPEVAGSNLGRGIDFGYYPQVRSFTGGVQLQF